MLTKEEETLLYFAGYVKCICASRKDLHWRPVDDVNLEQNAILEPHARYLLYGK